MSAPIDHDGGSVVVNAKITGTMLGVEDHGILSSMVFLDYGGSCQGFGGYAFDTPVFDRSRVNATSSARGEFKGRRGCAFGMEYIRRLLETIGVEKWEALPGTHVRVRKTGDEWGRIAAIGHIIKDSWFDPKALAEEMKNA